MKKYILRLCLMAFLSFGLISLGSCRDERSTGEKVEDNLEEAGEDIEDGAEDVEEELEDLTDDH